LDIILCKENEPGLSSENIPQNETFAFCSEKFHQKFAMIINCSIYVEIIETIIAIISWEVFSYKLVMMMEF